MANTSLFINQGSLDSAGNVWCVGRDLTSYNGSGWSYFDNTNSSVPSNSPYYLDTRSISIDSDDVKWVGCAVSSGLSQTLVFNVSEANAATGESWSLSNFNLTSSPNWEASSIFASPYGNEVIAFITPLNGGGGTGATGNVGVTGGYLWKYDKISEKWSEVAPGYTWPHIYDIQVKGKGGVNYDYYLSTEQGIQIIPSGTLDVEYLEDGSETIKSLIKINSFNSGLPSNVVYSLSFDEFGNYWVGTDSGISYWDGKKFYNWDSPNSNPVTLVQSRANGHVFFREGNPFWVPSLTSGFYHFNGDTFTLFDSSNSNLPNNDVIDLLLATKKQNKGTLTVFPNDLWVINGNEVTLFDYVIPHVYASSKYAGTTGWNFIDYTSTATGATTDSANLPKAEKFNWVYPSWQGYDNFNLAENHPGMDPRNLFLTTDFKAIANGEAANQNYWNSGQVIPYSEQSEAEKIQDSDWVSKITANSIPTLTSVTRFKNFNVVTGYSGSDTINFGPSSNTEVNYSISNPNPTYGGTGSTATNNLGFVAFYTDAGDVSGVIPFRGYDTRILNAKPSDSGDSLIVLGAFTRFIEAGKFVYNSEYPNAASQNVTGVTGPVGGPIGFSNIATPGITGSYDYPWILNSATGATSGIYIPDPGVISNGISYFVAEVDFSIGDQISYGGINFTNETISSRYCLKNFRYFPSAQSLYDPNGSPGTLSSQIRQSDLSVSSNKVRFTGNLVGGFSTLKGAYGNENDSPNAPDFFFTEYNSSGSSYYSSGFVLEMSRNFFLNSVSGVGLTGGNSYVDYISSLPNGQTFLLTGTSISDVNFNGLEISHPNPSYSYPWFALSNSGRYGITGSFFANNNNNNTSPYTNWQKTSAIFNSSDKYFASMLYTGTGSMQNFNNTIKDVSGASGALNAAIFGIGPGGLMTLESNYEILDNDFETVYTAKISGVSGVKPNDSYYLAVYHPEFSGSSNFANTIIKRSVTGTLIDEFSTFPATGNTNQDNLKIHVSEDLNMLLAGTNVGQTGPTGLPYSSASNIFISLSESYKPGVGIDLGNIISRAGSGAWTWVDVHNSSSDLLVPMLSTVFLSNYDSSIFGKQNNRWILKDASTDQVILDVKFTPYFIYTFTRAGYYSIYNSVEDSAGNVYEVSKPAFIKVVNQSIPSQNDPNPEYVNSADYGYLRPNKGFENEIGELSKDLLEQQAEIVIQNIQPFGSGLVIPNSPNSTFRQT
jgi:hypothetical protein